jgi:hypothetical protein
MRRGRLCVDGHDLEEVAAGVPVQAAVGEWMAGAEVGGVGGVVAVRTSGALQPFEDATEGVVVGPER